MKENNLSLDHEDSREKEVVDGVRKKEKI